VNHLSGRVLVAALFLRSAIAHLTQTAALAGSTTSRGVPMASLATRVTRAQIAVGGLKVLLTVTGPLFG